MKKHTKKQLPKNKILLLLCIILALSIALLSISISTDAKQNDDYVAPYMRGTVEAEKLSQDDAFYEMVYGDENQVVVENDIKQKTDYGARIIRSENGTVSVVSASDQVQTAKIATRDAPRGFSLNEEKTDETKTALQENASSAQTPTGNNASNASATNNTNVANDNAPQLRQDFSDFDPNGYLKNETFLPAGSAGTLYFVFDDAGHNLTQVKPFLDLPFPLTIAVLPCLEYSLQVANLARASGKEVILHQPMQALKSSIDPGPGAILPNMSADDAKNLVAENLLRYGPFAGLNNHEGSAITEDANLTGAVLDACKSAGVYFLDSRTTAKSTARVEAQKRGMHIFERSVFLDNSQAREDMITAVRVGMELASKNGSAVLIGHVWSSALAEVLLELYPEMLMSGYALSVLSVAE